jgi:SAM-dependent methyltransferase
MKLNKVCNLEDWQSEERAQTIRKVLPYFLQQDPAFPKHMEHRKHWEFAQVLLGLEVLGVLRADALVLSVAAGHEEVVYEMTNHVRWVFATDIYGTGPFTGWEADMTMLRDPDAFARLPYNRRRLVVQYMDALDLRFEDGVFDAVYSLSSIEHFGGADGVRLALTEQTRVVKPGGIVAFTTEVIINGADEFEEGHLLLSTPEQLDALCHDLPGLHLIEPIDFSVTSSTAATVTSLAQSIDNSSRGVTDYPHIVVEHEGRHFTSVSVFLQRAD